MIKETYNKIYSENKWAFGVKPSAVVNKLLEYLKSGKILDLGAGDGRNSIFLAGRGFEVTAIDTSTAAIEKLEKYARENSLKIKAVVGDIRNFDFQKQDAILAILVFHHLSPKEVLKVVEKMKAATQKGGINILSVITKSGDFYKENPNTDRFYADEGEIKSWYIDWEILGLFSRRWQAFQKRADGSPMFNTSQEMIARKK